MMIIEWRAKEKEKGDQKRMTSLPFASVGILRDVVVVVLAGSPRREVWAA